VTFKVANKFSTFLRIIIYIDSKIKEVHYYIFFKVYISALVFIFLKFIKSEKKDQGKSEHKTNAIPHVNLK